MKLKSNVLICFTTLCCLCWFLLGCQVEDDDDNKTSVAIKEGVFLDSAVEGITYASGAQSGTTDSAGTFKYEEGKTVKFLLGGIHLGEGTAKATMTPVDIVDGAENSSNTTVLNISRLLQTLDEDGDPSNGIKISNSVSEAVKEKSLDFMASDFDTKATTLLNEINVTTPLISAGVAQAHLDMTIAVSEGNEIPEPTQRIAVLIPEALEEGDTTRKEIRSGIALGLKSLVDNKVVGLDFYNPVGSQGTKFTQCTDSENHEFTTTTDGAYELYFGKNVYTSVTQDDVTRCEKSQQVGLYDQENVIAVVTARTSFAEEVTSVFEKSNLQVVSVTATSTTLENVQGKNLIMMAPNNNTQADSILAETKTNTRKAVMILDKQDDYFVYSQDLGSDMILKTLDPVYNSQMKLVSTLPLNYEGTTPNVPTSTLKSIYDARGDQNLVLIYIGGHPGLDATVAAVENDSGIDNSNIEWVVSDASFSDDTLTLFNNSGSLKSAKLTAISLGLADNSTNAYKHFAGLYENNYSASPSVWSEWGYDTGKFLSTILEDMLIAKKEITRANFLGSTGVSTHTGITGTKGTSVESNDRGTFNVWHATTSSNDSSKLMWMKP